MREKFCLFAFGFELDKAKVLILLDFQLSFLDFLAVFRYSSCEK